MRQLSEREKVGAAGRKMDRVSFRETESEVAKGHDDGTVILPPTPNLQGQGRLWTEWVEKKEGDRSTDILSLRYFALKIRHHN